MFLRALVLAFALCTVATSAALAAKPEDRGDTPGLGFGSGDGVSVGVPGPIAGAGLPLAAAIGGYIWLQRRHRRDKALKTNG